MTDNSLYRRLHDHCEENCGPYWSVRYSFNIRYKLRPSQS